MNLIPTTLNINELMLSTIADTIDKDTEKSGLFVLVQGRAREQAESEATNKAIVDASIAEQNESCPPVHLYAFGTTLNTEESRSENAMW